MNNTTNYNLKKPEATDFYDVDDFNGNADIIDAKLKQALNGARESALAIADGGTGATNASAANAAINYRGLNQAPATDLPANYTAGIYVSLEDSSSNLPYMPTTVGLLATYKGGANVAQLWFAVPTGKMYRRSGNATGWDGSATIGDSRGWVEDGTTLENMILDESAKTLTASVSDNVLKIGGAGSPYFSKSIRHRAYKPILGDTDFNPFGTYGTIWDIKIDGRYAYAVNTRSSNNMVKWELGTSSTIKKLSIVPTGADATDLPEHMTDFYKSGSSFNGKSIAVGKNYIYLAIRYSSGTTADGVHYYGGIAVIRKSDFTVIKCYWTLGMGNRAVLSPDERILAVANQMRGITFYSVDPATGYLTQIFQDIYDQSSGSPMKTCESQGGTFYSDGTHLYYLNVGFSKGLTLYDCTDPSDISYVTQWNFSDFLPSYSGHMHTYSAIVDYPYAYITTATKKEEVSDLTSTYCGVVVLNISNPNSVTCTDYEKIDIGDVEAYRDSGDPLPSEMCRFGNCLVLDYEKGILVFEITADRAHVEYVGKYFADVISAGYGIASNGVTLVCGGEINNAGGYMLNAYGIASGGAEDIKGIDTIELNGRTYRLQEQADMVEGAGTVSVTLADHTEYRYLNVSSLTMTGARAKAHGIIVFGSSAPSVTISGFMGISGDDITEAAAGSAWEFDCEEGFCIFKEWEL